MPDRVLHYGRTLDGFADLVAERRNRSAAEALAAAREAICNLLHDQVGHDFSGYKEKTFWRRVHRRMQVLQVQEVPAYIERLRASHAEVMALFRDLLIGVTDFFRDPDAFNALAEIAIPKLFADKTANNALRVWVPACATGEEAYTLAILLREHMDRLAAPPKAQIFGTDIDEHALRIARAGRYPASLVSAVSPERRKRFFTQQDDTYTIAQQIRDMCVFSPHSIIRDPPFSRIDLISCRNLLIYLDANAQARVIPTFHYALRPGGFLLLGSSENVTQFPELFQPVHKKHRIFQRRDQVAAAADIPLLLSGIGARHAHAPAQAREAVPNALTLLRSVQAHILERFAPAHVLVNRDGDVIHYSAGTGKYLEPAPGLPTRQLLAQARRGLRSALHAALREAVEKRHGVRRDNVVVETEDGRRAVDLAVEPFDRGEADGLFLVVFSDRPAPPQGAAVARQAGLDRDATVEQLETELRDTRERLQSTIEEYEASVEELRSANEEMQSINEELQSTNEELVTSKEELQSVNEELHTVNAELRAKIEELDRANSDLRNLFESTRVATVFLDPNLAVRSFTPAIGEIFNLISSDHGRPLTHLTSFLDYDSLEADCRAVLGTRQPLERRLRRRDGSAHYLMRIFPYLGSGNGVDGVVMTFVNITDIIRAEEALAESEARLRAAVDASGLGIWSVDPNAGRDVDAATLDRIFRLPASGAGAPPDGAADRVHPEDLALVQAAWRRMIEGDGTYEAEHRILRAEGEVRWVRSRGRLIRDGDGRPLYATGAIFDITERKGSERR
jgi:two-component system CheB/CheR fusion protein